MVKRNKQTLKAYERLTKRKVIKPKISKKVAYILYWQVGLSEEVGELCGKLKRLLRDKGGELTDAIREDIAYELGDILWNLTQIARLFGFSLERIMEMNIQKLDKRIQRGTIRGKGDKR